MAAAMTTPPGPGEQRPVAASGTSDPSRRRVTLDRPPGDRYLPARSARAASNDVLRGVRGPLLLVAGGTLVFVVLGGILGITAGLIVAAGILGWLTGLIVRPPLRAAVVGLVAVTAGLLGIWLFGRWEGGVLDPITYLAEVQGFVVPLELLAGAGMAAAASR